MAPGARRPPLPTFSFVVVAMAGACLGLTACGGSSSNSQSGEPSGRKAAEQKMVKFAKCLREHGINAETGGPGGGFGIHIGPGPGEGKPGSSGPPPQFLAAQRACKQYAPPGPFANLSPAQKAEEKQKMLGFARCMRSHGVDVPDPGPSGVLELHNIDPRSASFQTAQQACQHLMGNTPVAINAQIPGPGGPGGSHEEGGSSQSTAPAGGGEK
jgi:hypothetical protein